MNEADTPAELIDKQLEASGWTTSAETGVRVRREFNINDRLYFCWNTFLYVFFFSSQYV